MLIESWENREAEKLVKETAKNKIRKFIQQTLQEAICNFIEPQKETKTEQLTDTSTPEVIGDPISDVKMNQMDHNLGSDGKNAQTTSVKAGNAKGGNDYTAGQRRAIFSDKTKQAE